MLTFIEMSKTSSLMFGIYKCFSLIPDLKVFSKDLVSFSVSALQFLKLRNPLAIRPCLHISYIISKLKDFYNLVS